MLKKGISIALLTMLMAIGGTVVGAEETQEQNVSAGGGVVQTSEEGSSEMNQDLGGSAEADQSSSSSDKEADVAVDASQSADSSGSVTGVQGQAGSLDIDQTTSSGSDYQIDTQTANGTAIQGQSIDTTGSATVEQSQTAGVQADQTAGTTQSATSGGTLTQTETTSGDAHVAQGQSSISNSVQIQASYGGRSYTYESTKRTTSGFSRVIR